MVYWSIFIDRFINLINPFKVINNVLLLLLISQITHIISQALSNSNLTLYRFSRIEYWLNLLDCLLLSHMSISKPLENFLFEYLKFFCFLFSFFDDFTFFDNLIVFQFLLSFKSTYKVLFMFYLAGFTHDLLFKSFFLSSSEILLLLLILNFLKLFWFFLHYLCIYFLIFLNLQQFKLKIVVKLFLLQNFISCLS